MKSLLLIIGLLLATLSPPLTPPCATVDATLGHDPVQSGQTQTISTLVTNCSDGKTKLGLTISVTDAIGNISVIRNTIQNYNAGQSVTFNDSYPIPASGPTGTWRVIAIVHDNSPQGGSAELARDTVEFQVTN